MYLYIYIIYTHIHRYIVIYCMYSMSFFKCRNICNKLLYINYYFTYTFFDLFIILFMLKKSQEIAQEEI